MILLPEEATRDQATRCMNCRATEETKPQLDEKLVATLGIGSAAALGGVPARQAVIQAVRDAGAGTFNPNP
jgi:hypothetical protein